jgi:hypothetical protein
MPEESKTTEFTAISKGLEASKVLGSVALVLYVVGFLVVTFHVAQFGFVPVSWLRPQYLLAGIWCLLPTLLLVWIISYGIGQSLTLLGKTPGTQPPPKSSRFRNLTGMFLSVVGFVIATYVGFGLIGAMFGQPITVTPSRPNVVIALKLVGFYLAALITGITGVVTLIGARKLPRQLSVRFVSEWSSVTLLLCFSLAMGVGYIRYFSTSVYSAIPSAVGGGRPQDVIFLLDKEHGEPPVTADSSGIRSVPYQLLLKTDSTYVVQSHKTGEKAIEFRQESVKGMVTLEYQKQ